MAAPKQDLRSRHGHGHGRDHGQRSQQSATEARQRLATRWKMIST